MNTDEKSSPACWPGSFFGDRVIGSGVHAVKHPEEDICRDDRRERERDPDAEEVAVLPLKQPFKQS